MKALKLVGPGRIEIQEVPIPEIAADEVLVKVAGAGLCQSDLHLLDMDGSWPFFGGTMGHETAGYVYCLGPQVTGLTLGEAVLVSVIWSCGQCRACVAGRENACATSGSRTQFPTTPGIGPDGGMAEYIKVRARHLTKIGSLDPASAAPLADAGVTPMHAINHVSDLLTPDATVVVIGVGGLGHMAIQLLAATAESRIVAVDRDESRLPPARIMGADLAIRSDETTVSNMLAQTLDYGAEVVLDFVGTQDTVDLASRIVAPAGAIQVIGVGRGTLRFPTGAADATLPWGVRLQRSYGGTLGDQHQVISLAQQGKVTVHTVRYPLSAAAQAFDDLAQGRVPGRAVLTP